MWCEIPRSCDIARIQLSGFKSCASVQPASGRTNRCWPMEREKNDTFLFWNGCFNILLHCENPAVVQGHFYRLNYLLYHWYMTQQSIVVAKATILSMLSKAWIYSSAWIKGVLFRLELKPQWDTNYDGPGLCVVSHDLSPLIPNDWTLTMCSTPFWEAVKPLSHWVTSAGLCSSLRAHSKG